MNFGLKGKIIESHLEREKVLAGFNIQNKTEHEETSFFSVTQKKKNLLSWNFHDLSTLQRKLPYLPRIVTYFLGFIYVTTIGS